jgi:murein DD-endopeptidase MepM/ murein hydrolase activator NlpD
MATRVPTVEIIIRDEVSAGVERMRQRMRAEQGRDWFKGIETGLAAAGRAAQRLHRELSSLVSLTGAGALLGGGMVAGLVKLTESLGNLSRETLQMNATSASMGLTVKQFDQLIARGQAMGLTADQAKGQIGGLAKIIDELAVKGPKAARFAEIYKSKGGKEFLEDVVRATRRGGTQAGIEEYINSMGRVISRTGRNLVGEFAGLSPVWPKALEVDQKDLVDKLQIGEEAAQKLNLELVKLQITLENVKKTAAIAVLPAMTELVKAFDTFVSGPGAAVVKQFGEWLASLNIDWKAVTAGIVSITEALTKFFQGLDPIVQQMGGWKIIIAGLAGGAVLGLLVSRLGGISSALLLIGNAAWVVPLLGMAAFTSMATNPTGGGAEGVKGQAGTQSGPAAPRPGGGGGGGQPATPAPTAPAPAPYGRDRRGRPYPAPQETQPGRRSSLDFDPNDPENAAPYRVAGGWQPPPGYLKAGDTEQLRTTVGTVTENVTRLAENIAALGLNTDASGAGPMAGVAGRVTRGAPSGGSSRRASTSGPPRTSGPRTSAPPRPARVADTTVSPADDEFRIGQGPLPSEAQLADKSVPAGRRFNNPFNMWHDRYAAQQGGVPGRKITPYDTPAIFPSGQAGAAAVIRKMMESPLYANKTMWDLIEKWVSHGAKGGYAPWIAQQTGIPVSTRITREFLMSDDGLKFLKAMARYETKSSEEYPLTDEQWRAARDAAARIRRPGSQANPAPSQTQPADPKVPPANQQPNTARTNTEGLVSPVTGKFGENESNVYGARRRGGRPHSGVDWRAEDGTPAVAMTDGVVTAVGYNRGGYDNYAWVKGSDGVFRRYAYHGRSLVQRGQTVTQGMPLGIIGRRHLHYEEVHPTGPDGRPNPVYQELVRRGDVSTSYQRGTTDPRRSLGLEYGAPVKAGEQIGGPTEKEKQQRAQTAFDEYLQKQRANEAERPSFAARARAGRLKVNINLRGPRGVKGVVSDSSGGVSTTINREMDPTGGGQIQSPA